MYKVFFNDNVLCFYHKNKTSLKNNKTQVAGIECHSDSERLFSKYSFMELTENLDVVCSDPEKIWKSFCEKLTKIPAAGGLLNNSKSEILFISRFGRWDLPKGKIEDGESIEQAAIREVEEECGLRNVKIKKQLNSTFHLYFSPYINSDDNLVLKETFWFEMVYNGNEEPTPQTSEHIEKVRWFAKNDLKEVYDTTYNNLIELLDNYLA